MAKTLDIRPQVSELVITLRFAQGYRFLDSCGEAVIQLENTLEEGWIPGDLTPTGGFMRNYTLGLLARFDAQQLTVQQNEYIAFDMFADQATKIYETLWRLFRIDEIMSPAMRFDIQVGFENLEDAERYVQSIGYLDVSKKVFDHMGGEVSAMNYVICTEAPVKRFDHELIQRRRLSVRAHQYTKQPDFDSRVMQRVNLLAPKHRDAVKPLLEMRRKHVASISNGAEISVEDSLEGDIETRSFAMREFLDGTWKYVQSLMPHYRMRLEIP